MEVAVPIRPGLKCGMPARPRLLGVFSRAADRLTVAHVGGRRPPYATDLSSRGCCSARRENGSFGKSRLSGGARFPLISSSRPNHRTRRDSVAKVRAEKDETGAEETPEVAANLGQPIIVKKSALFTSLDFWVQVAIFVFAAGLVDAGFSGDWSRIGVLSKQTEEELQIAALGVVPLAITLIWSISQRRKSL